MSTILTVLAALYFPPVAFFGRVKDRLTPREESEADRLLILLGLR